MEYDNDIIILEPLYSDSPLLRTIEISLRKIELETLILPKIKKIMKKNKNVKIVSPDKNITSILSDKGFQNTFEINYIDKIDIEKRSREISEELYQYWIKKNVLEFDGIDFVTVLQCEVIWEIHELLSKFETYNDLMKKENIKNVYTESNFSLESKIINSACTNLNINHFSFYPDIYGKIRNFLVNLVRYKGFKASFNEIGLYLKETKPVNITSKKKILIDATYKNYLINIIPVLKQVSIENEFDCYFLSRKDDLDALNVEFKTINKFNFNGKYKGMKKILGELFDNSNRFNKIFDYDNTNLQWLKKELRYSTKKKLPYLLKKMEIAKGIISNLSPNIILIGDDRSVMTRSSILPAKQKNIPVLEVQHGLYDKPNLMITPISDKICAWGNYTKCVLMEAGTDEKTIEITGSPQYDFSLEKYSKYYKKQRDYSIILFATQPIYNYINLKVIEKIGSFLNQNNEFKLLVKPHPIENVEFYKSLEQKFRGVTVLDSNKNITDVLIKSDIFITFSSTTGIEAAILNKPIICLNIKDKDSIYTSNGIAVEVKDENHITNAIYEISHNKELIKKMEDARKNFAYEHNYLNDMQASKRIADIIQKY